MIGFLKRLFWGEKPVAKDLPALSLAQRDMASRLGMPPEKYAGHLQKLKLKEVPEVDVSALAARYAKTQNNGKRRHHKGKVAHRPHHF